MLAKHYWTGLTTGLILVASTQISVAVDADSFAKAFSKSYASQGADITYSGVESSGDTVTLKSVAVNIPGDTGAMEFGDLVFSGVSESGNGGYTVESLSEDQFDFTAEEMSVSVRDIKIENLKIPGETTGYSLDDILYYDAATTGPITLTFEGRDVLKVAKTDTRLARQSGDAQVNMSSRFDGLEIDLSDVKDAKAQQAINGMGYQYLSGDLVIDGNWILENGQINLSEYALTLNDVGRLDINLSISGYTLDFAQGVQKLQTQMVGKESDPKAQQAMGLAMLGMMQQLTFNNLSIRFDDASLTNKVLEMVASQQGMTRDQMVQGVKGMLPFALGQLQNPAFQKSVTEAVGIYLDDPKSLEIKAQPDAPVPFSSVAGSAMSAPQSLPDVLNITVTANQ